MMGLQGHSDSQGFQAVASDSPRLLALLVARLPPQLDPTMRRSVGASRVIGSGESRVGGRCGLRRLWGRSAARGQLRQV